MPELKFPELVIPTPDQEQSDQTLQTQESAELPVAQPETPQTPALQPDQNPLPQVATTTETLQATTQEKDELPVMIDEAKTLTNEENLEDLSKLMIEKRG